MSPFTFHFHDLISVLDHLIFGFVAEGMSPGLDQVQDLVSDIWFRLFLVVKEPHNEKKSLGNPSCVYIDFCCQLTLF